MQKSLDQKLAILAQDRYHKSFILADAKDADMAFGIAAPGKSPEMHSQEGKFRTIHEYRDQIRQVIRQGLVDILLMSCSTSDLLTLQERLFDNSPITPAARANDATDIHVIRHGTYIQHPAQPHRTTTIDHMQCGKLDCPDDQRACGANLGLYSVTFNNIPELDFQTLEAYKAFRLEAEAKRFKHFLEVFDPNVDPRIPSEKIGEFINDHICRALAGVPKASRPVFLKIVYHGPRYMEELCRYDESVIVGILGGSSGTTYDAFKQLAEAKKYGARVALYGRKINNSEHQLEFIRHLRAIADDQITPEDAVRSYHGSLQNLQIKPYRPLADDLQLTSTAVSYGGSSPTTSGSSGGVTPSLVPSANPAQPLVKSIPSAPQPSGPKPPWPTQPDGSPDFENMSLREKQLYQKSKRDKVFGGPK